MQGIMFNERVGMESATLDGSKTRTSRNELDRKKKHTEEEWEFIDLLYDNEDIKSSVAFSFDGVNTFSIKDSYYDFYFKTHYKVGEILAIKQSYLAIKHPQYDKFGRDLTGNHNKMFVRCDLMPHHIQIVDIKLERLQGISDEDCLKEGVFKTLYATNGHIYYSTSRNCDIFYLSAKDAFASLIDKVSGKGTWKLNNWNVVYYYKIID